MSKKYNPYKPNMSLKIHLTTNGSFLNSSLQFGNRDLNLGELDSRGLYFKEVETPNFIFEASLSFYAFHKFSGTIHVEFRETNGERIFKMSFPEFERLLKEKNVPIYPGVTWIGRWSFKTRSIYYIPDHISID